MEVASRDVSIAHAGVNCLDAVGALGIRAVDLLIDREMTTSRFTDPNGEAYDLGDAAGRERFRGDLASAGVRICGLTLMTEFTREDLDAEIEWAIRACGLTAELDADALRVDPWMREPGMPVQAFRKRMASAIRRVLAETDGVPIGVENHGYQGNQPEFLEALIGEVASDRFGLTLDTGNFYWAGHPLDTVYDIIERFAGVVKYTHVKNIRYPEDKRQVNREPGWEYLKHVSPVPDGDVDHARVVQALSAAGYDGALVIEDESHVNRSREDYAKALRRDVRHLQGVLT